MSLTMNDLYVELMLASGEFREGVIEDFSNTEVEVRLLETKLEPSSTIRTSYSCVFITNSRNRVRFQQGDKCELARKQDDFPPVWIPATVKEHKGPFYTCIFEENGNLETVIVDEDLVRSPIERTLLDRESLMKFDLMLTSEQATMTQDHHILLKKRLPNSKLYVDTEKKTLVCLTYSLDVMRKAHLLFMFHLHLLDQIIKLRNNNRAVKKRYEHEKKLHAALVSQQLITETFQVDRVLLGLVVGKMSNNLLAARRIPGIIKIDINSETGDIWIMGTSSESVQEARSMLEYVIVDVSLPTNMIGQVIGRRGQMVQFFERLTSVTSINKASEVASEGNRNLTTIQITGRKGNVSDALAAIEYFIEHIGEKERINMDHRCILNQLNNFQIRKWHKEPEISVDPIT